jgi:hypothetical protein
MNFCTRTLDPFIGFIPQDSTSTCKMLHFEESEIS